MAKKPVGNSYKALLSKSSEEVALEELDNKVERAALEFAQGLLSIEGKILTLKGNLKKAENAFKDAEKALRDAKSSNPEGLVQRIVEAYQARKQAEYDVNYASNQLEEMNELKDYLEIEQSELFPA